MPSLNWNKARMEKKIRVQGASPHEDLLPRAPSGARLTPKGNTVVKPSAGTRVKRKKKLPVKALRPARLRYLEMVVDAHVRGETLPKPSRKMTVAERQAIDRHPSKLDWARAQPEFGTLEERKRKKLAKRLGKEKPKAKTDPATVESSHKDLAEHIAFLRSEIAAARKFISAAEKEITKLQGQLGNDNK